MGRRPRHSYLGPFYLYCDLGNDSVGRLSDEEGEKIGIAFENETSWGRINTVLFLRKIEFRI